MGDGLQICPRYQRAADLLGKRWVAHIIRVLLPGPLRFARLVEAIPGLSDRLLCERLKELEATGIVSRRVYPDVPVRVEYALTTKGSDLGRVVSELQDWANRWDISPAAISTSPSFGESLRAS